MTRRTVAVASGKGGVGKSTVTLNLARALYAGGARVGVLDADLYGPNLPAMLDLRQTRELRQWSLWRGTATRLAPLEREGLLVMSAGLLLGERQTFPGAGPTLELVLRQLVDGVDWGELDYLLIDLPPGTADLQEELFRVVALDGVVVVVTPQYVAHLDARRLVSLVRHAGVRLLGAVENMSGLTCPHCGEHVDVFPAAPDDRTLWHDDVERLATFPLDPNLDAAAFAPLAETLERLLAA